VNSTARLLLLAALPALLSSCFWPQKYVLDLEVSPQGTVKVHYAGQLVHLLPRMAQAEARQKGKVLTVKDVQQLEQMNAEVLAEFKHSPGIKQVRFLGNDTFQLDLRDTKTLVDGQTYKPLADLLTIRRTGKKVWVEFQKVKTKDVAQLQALNLSASGQIRVTTGGKVLTHNARRQDILSQTYSWKMNRLDAPSPTMTIQLP
jgi:hypothetical protein